MEQTDNDGSNVVACSTPEDESKRRREMLNRRPSYRKILNDISSADTAAGILDEVQNNNNSDQRTNENQSHSSSASSTNTSSHIVVSNSETVLSLAQPTANLSTNSTSVSNSHTDQNNNDTIHIGPSYIKMIPTAMQIQGDQDLLPTTVHLSNHPNSTPHQQVNHGIVQYASSNPEPQFIFSGNKNYFQFFLFILNF